MVNEIYERKSTKKKQNNNANDKFLRSKLAKTMHSNKLF